jgi:hypothetical protein
MGKSKKNKSQHFVPRVYLGAWTDPETPAQMDPYVWIFERKSREGRRKAPVNIFEETDFYTTEGADGERDLRVEEALNRIETRFVKARQKIEKHQRLSAREHVDLVAFVAAMEGRTKAQRDHQRRQWGEVKEKMDLMIDADARLTPDQRRARRSAPSVPGEDSGGTYEDVERFLTYPMRVVVPAMIEAMAPILAMMHWMIFETDDPIGFITSDAPCVIVDPAAYRRGPMYRGAGLGYQTTEVSMALSPRQLVAFTHHDGCDGYFGSDRQILDEFNRRAWMRSYEHYIVRKNETLDAWFEKREDPPDSWENTHGRRDDDDGA